MFGTYRTFLALTVLYTHYAGAPFIGNYAVFGFFTLSGYLMTLIMQRKYGYTARGFIAYAANRVLRIYPPYWASCALALVILAVLGSEYTTAVNARYALPDDAVNWVRNLGLLLTHTTSPSLVHPAWALSVELFYYVVIGAGLSRNRRITLVWLACSFAYTVYLNLIGASFAERYFTLAAASLPFATGAAVYHWREEIAQRCAWLAQQPTTPYLLCGLLLGNWAVADWRGEYTHLHFYVNTIICTLALISLFRRRELAPLSRRFDAWFGDLSYPVYVVHFPLGFALLAFYGWAGLPVQGAGQFMFWLSLPIVIAVAWLLAVAVEKPAESARSRIKRGLRRAQDEPPSFAEPLPDRSSNPGTP